MVDKKFIKKPFETITIRRYGVATVVNSEVLAVALLKDRRVAEGIAEVDKGVKCIVTLTFDRKDGVKC
jgi:hypothetical protein